MGLVPPPPGMTDLEYVEGMRASQVVMINAGPASAGVGCAQGQRRPAAGRRAAAQPQTTVRRRRRVDGLPLVKPPYGTITAINLDNGDILWQVAHGDTPDEIKNNPALKGIDIPRTGQTGQYRQLVTKTLVIAGDAAFTDPPDHPRGAMLRAYDQKTGKEVGAVLDARAADRLADDLQLDGKQYIIVAVSRRQLFRRIYRLYPAQQLATGDSRHCHNFNGDVEQGGKALQPVAIKALITPVPRGDGNGRTQMARAQTPQMQVANLIAIALQRVTHLRDKPPVWHHIQKNGAGIAHQAVRPARNSQSAEKTGDRVHP